MLDVMSVYSGVSQCFQKDALLINDVVDTLETANLRLESFKISPGKCYSKFVNDLDATTGVLSCGKDGDHQVSLKGQRNLQAPLKKTFDKICDDLLKYLDIRFKSLYQAPVKCFQVFHHHNLPTDRKELIMYGNSDVQTLVDYYSDLLSDEEQEGAVDQWLDLKQRLNNQRHLPPMEVYQSLLQSRPEGLKCVLLLVEIMLTLSPSTAKIERSFSAMKGTKTVLKSKMNQDTLQMLMRISDSDETLSTFEAGPVIEKWLSVTQRKVSVVKDNVSSFSDKVPSIPEECDMNTVEL
jgi:hypothetical protein